MDYFTKEEVRAVKDALADVSGAGIKVQNYMSEDEQIGTFFDKAKLWRVIKQVISVLYIERLAAGQMFLVDANGDEYQVRRLDRGLVKRTLGGQYAGS